jgi:DNA-binding transcriptional MerR regulator
MIQYYCHINSVALLPQIIQPLWRENLMPDRNKPESSLEKTKNSEFITIDELSGRSEVPSRTIRYYTHEGLLPPPVLRGRIGLYGKEHQMRLELIKKLQKETYLPLSVIREVVTDPEKTEVLDHNLKLKEEVFSALGYDLESVRFGRRELALSANLPLKQIQELERIGLIVPENTRGARKYDRHDVEIAKMAKKFLDVGFSIDSLGGFSKILDQLADEEKDMFYREFQQEIDRDPDKVIQIAKEMVAATNHLILNLHTKLVQRKIEKEIFKYPYSDRHKQKERSNTE